MKEKENGDKGRGKDEKESHGYKKGMASLDCGRAMGIELM